MASYLTYNASEKKRRENIKSQGGIPSVAQYPANTFLSRLHV